MAIFGFWNIYSRIPINTLTLQYWKLIISTAGGEGGKLGVRMEKSVLFNRVNGKCQISGIVFVTAKLCVFLYPIDGYFEFDVETNLFNLF